MQPLLQKCYNIDVYKGSGTKMGPNVFCMLCCITLYHVSYSAPMREIEGVSFILDAVTLLIDRGEKIKLTTKD